MEPLHWEAPANLVFTCPGPGQTGKSLEPLQVPRAADVRRWEAEPVPGEFPQRELSTGTR